MPQGRAATCTDLQGPACCLWPDAPRDQLSALPATSHLPGLAGFIGLAYHTETPIPGPPEDHPGQLQVLELATVPCGSSSLPCQACWEGDPVPGFCASEGRLGLCQHEPGQTQHHCCHASVHKQRPPLTSRDRLRPAKQERLGSWYLGMRGVILAPADVLPAPYPPPGPL